MDTLYFPSMIGIHIKQLARLFFLRVLVRQALPVDTYSSTWQVLPCKENSIPFRINTLIILESCREHTSCYWTCLSTAFGSGMYAAGELGELVCGTKPCYPHDNKISVDCDGYGVLYATS